MDRVTSKAAFVVEALALIAAPACACDAHGRVWAANAAMAELSGTLDGRTLLDLFDTDTLTASAALAIAAPGNVAREGRWEAVLATGTRQPGRVVEVRARPLPAACGPGATFVFGAACRSQTEADLRGTVLRQATVLEHAPVGVAVTLPNLVKSCNPRMASMLGYTPDELVNCNPLELFAAPAQYEAFVAAAVGVLVGGGLFEDEIQLRHRDGALVWCRIRAKAVDMSAREAGTVWIVEDITEARRALTEVQAIMTSATIGIFFTRERVFTRYNHWFAEMFGYGESEYIGRSTRSMYVDEADYRTLGGHAYDALSEGRPFRCECTMVRKDGTPMWVSVIGYPANPGEMGQGTMIWMIEDRSSKKHAEESLRNALLENQALLDELEVRVQERTAELQAEIVERRQAEARVHHMAYHDALTGLPNRALLAERLDRALLAARRDGRGLALMFLDLDRFKAINDSLGHATGDHLLQEVARRLCRVVRASDTVARLGGDEFVVLVPGVRALEECALVGDKIIEALAGPVSFEGRTLHTSTSIGIALYPDDGADVDSLMRKADAAMYQAKAAGRNNYQFYADDMDMAEGDVERAAPSSRRPASNRCPNARSRRRR